ncbi:MAG: Rieske (2Fe-2S) protein [Sandaracinaceae bacterium]
MRDDANPDSLLAVVPLPPGPTGRPREALVVRAPSGALRAYLNRCRHLPIPLDGGSGAYFDPDGDYLTCGTHGARYRLEDGFCVEGPCMGDELIALRVRKIDTGYEVDPPDIDPG